MSRASAKRKKLQRAKSPSTGNTNGNMPSYNNSMNALVAQMQAKLQPGYNDVLFSPGLPLHPIPGVNPGGVPRQYSFPIVYNTSGVDRTLGKPDVPSFQQLRMLAKMYSGITLPERVWLDMVHGLKLTISLKPELKAQGMNDTDSDIQKSISNILTFFEKPDKQHDLHSWLKMMIRDQTQIDEMYLYKRRTRGGQLYALEVVDGSTMKPLLDDWGRIPEPPLGAYQQFPWGMPGEEYTTEDVIHYQETPQSDSPYGFGRVERFMMEVNQALRKKKRDLALFTEGNIPAGLMEVPETSNWTPDQIDNYEQMWNALIAGNTQQQVRVKFTQPGMKYIKTDNGEILTDFDYFLYKIACGTYGISLADIGFVEDIHKSSDQGQQNMMYRRTLYPIVTVYAHNIITSIIREEFHEDRLEASFTGYEEEEDFNTQASGFQILANIGAVAPSDIAHKMGLPDVPKTGPFILGKDGPIFLKDYEEDSPLRTAQTQAQLTGYQFAASNPGGVQPDQNEEGDNADETQQSNGKPQKDEGSQSSNSGQKSKDANKENKTDNKVSGNAKEKSSNKNGSTLNRNAESGDTNNTGMMIAFMLGSNTADQIALPNGEPIDEMHVTLAYLGDSREEPPQGKLHPLRTSENLSSVIRAFASASSPLQGVTGGLARFVNPGADKDPVVATVNVPGLQEWRRRLINILELAGYWISDDFDYLPHITLSYIDPDDPMPVDSIENVPLQFNELCLVIGDDKQYFPIGETNERIEYGRDDTSRSQVSEQAKRAELKRWRNCAVSDFQRRRNLRTFESDILPIRERANIQAALERCSTSEDIKEIFRSAQADPDFNWQDTDKSIQATLAAMKAKGVKSQQWICQPFACDECMQNNKKTILLGQRFPSGAYTTPNHNHCECTVQEIM